MEKLKTNTYLLLLIILVIMIPKSKNMGQYFASPFGLRAKVEILLENFNVLINY